MTKLVKCDFGIDSDKVNICSNATMDPLLAGYFRVFTPFVQRGDSSSDDEPIVLDFCCIAHLAGWALALRDMQRKTSDLKKMLIFIHGFNDETADEVCDVVQAWLTHNGEHRCNNCGRYATHFCTYHLHPEDVLDGLLMYHCNRHLCLHCEPIKEDQ